MSDLIIEDNFKFTKTYIFIHNFEFRSRRDEANKYWQMREPHLTNLLLFSVS